MRIFAIIYLLVCLSHNILLFSQIKSYESYKTPSEFMSLYYDFTGGKENSIGTMLSETAASNTKQDDGVLILILESDIYLYDTKRNLLGRETLRTSPNSGFFEVTAISHIGAAMSYLLSLKNRGDDRWKTAGYELLNSIRQVRDVNSIILDTNHWLIQLNQQFELL